MQNVANLRKFAASKPSMFDCFAIFPLFFATVFVILLLCGVTLILGHISFATSRRQISPLPRHLSTFHRICANAVVVPGHTSFIFWRHLATFFGAADLSIPQTCLNFWHTTVLLLKPSKNEILYLFRIRGANKRGSLRRAKFATPQTSLLFLHTFWALAPRTTLPTRILYFDPHTPHVKSMPGGHPHHPQISN